MRREIATLIFQLAWLAGTAGPRKIPTQRSRVGPSHPRELSDQLAGPTLTPMEILDRGTVRPKQLRGRDGFAPIHMYDAKGPMGEEFR
ncbi:MAG: hypothetical protein CM1200mP36_01510 [Gammaproteobacteria bacterium]|nr:MAG: hypothetical protein CM1200mP36_01510 [Gammaproteobacteria bacterium]